MSFKNKVVLVTGGNSGIGAAIAIVFAKEGADIAIVGRNEEKLKNAAAEIESVGNKPLVIKADVSKDDEAKDIIKLTVDKFGRLDVLVNCVGIMRIGNILDGTIMKTYDEIFATNVRAAIHLITLAAPHLIDTKGNIVNISGIAGLRILSPSITAYSVSRAAMDHLTRGVALELAPKGVRVNIIDLGPVRTDTLQNNGLNTNWDRVKEKTLLKKIAEPEEVAELVAFVASDKGRSITGSILISDNGMLLCP